MKKLIDGNKVGTTGYRFLLRFNKRNNHQMIDALYGVTKLKKLTLHQYNYMFTHVMQQETKILGKILEKTLSCQ